MAGCRRRPSCRPIASLAKLFSDAAERAIFINEVATRRGLSPAVVEKDLWVCWTLARLHEIPDMPAFTFKGGTSLSKVHGLIERFSEDIDLVLSRTGWGFDGQRDPLNPGLSRSKQNKLGEKVQVRSARAVRDVIIPGFGAICEAQLDSNAWSLEIDSAVSDLQTAKFAYPARSEGYGYLQPVIRLEFGARGDPWPTGSYSVKPFIEDVFPGAASAAVSMVDTLSAERTFWEKATRLHSLHHRSLGGSDVSARHQSRHLYDLHRMWLPLRDRLVTDPGLLDAVVTNTIVFFHSLASNYPLISARTLNLRPPTEFERRLQLDFEDMATMFFPGSRVPTFDAMIATLREIEAAVAEWPPACATRH